jgi:hypothetical protein
MQSSNNNLNCPNRCERFPLVKRVSFRSDDVKSELSNSMRGFDWSRMNSITKRSVIRRHPPSVDPSAIRSHAFLFEEREAKPSPPSGHQPIQSSLCSHSLLSPLCSKAFIRDEAVCSSFIVSTPWTFCCHVRGIFGSSQSKYHGFSILVVDSYALDSRWRSWR